jgi:leukotriene-A4 hydrolase
MGGRALFALGIALVAIAGRGEGMPVNAAEPSRAGERSDHHSFANPDQIRVRHVALNLAVDFAAKQLHGSATLTIERQPGCPADAPLVLDTRGLTIERVTAGTADGALAVAPFEVGPVDKILGAPLKIQVPEGATRVRIAYRTASDASALQWLDPAQTAGGQRPFLFTQSEAIHARSWIPLQDSPGVRVTYEATIQVPARLQAVMSAERKGPMEKPSFVLTKPIPPYLIALAVGDLAFRPLGPRTGVFAEPPVVDSAAHEFAETEAMIAAVERRFGPYRWGRYDLLILPPSFPYGGMENPMLTFATPTVIAGDRSLVSLVAHELAHSWSGNLVTNATWRDFWLNEGFTTYLERRIVADVFGPERAAMEAVLGLQELREELKRVAPRDQVLHVDVTGRDPEESLSHIPYEKGSLLLTTLEHRFGRARFDEFLRGYFDHFAFQSITTADFEKYLREHLFSLDREAAAAIDLQAWIHEPGLPEGFPQPHSARFDEIDRLARAWLEGKIKASELGAAGWSTLEWLHLMRGLPEQVPAAKLAELDQEYHLTGRTNAEITHQWLLVAIRSGYAPAEALVEPFLLKIGRMKYLRPLYQALAKTPEGKARAQAIYAKARPHYHPIAAEAIDRILGAPAAN